MARWEPTKGVEMIPCPVNKKELEFAIEQAAKIIYKWVLRVESSSQANQLHTVPSLQNLKEIRK